MSDLVLFTGAKSHRGFNSIEVTRSIECASGSFNLSGPGALLSGIEEDAACQLRLDGQKALTGYIDEVATDITAEDYTIAVTGRDKVADLIDCSPLIPEYKDLRIDQIAARVCKPFGITVVAPYVRSVYGEPFKLVSGEPGETVFQFLDRLARARGVLMWSDGLGGLVMGWPTLPQLGGVKLREGENVVSFSQVKSSLERFKTVTVLAQQPGTDNAYGDYAAAAKAVKTDSQVKRYRPLTVLSEQAADVATLKTRAGYELRSRRARGERLTATVKGWTVPGTKVLWPLGHSVPVFSPRLGLEGKKLIIAGATHTRDEKEGDLTILELAPRGALDRAIEPESATDE